MSEGDNQARRPLQIPDLYMFFLQIKKQKKKTEWGIGEWKHGIKHRKHAEEQREKKAKNKRGGMERER